MQLFAKDAETGRELYTGTVIAGTLLSAALGRGDVYIDASCGGMGRCGKCRVRFVSGAPDPTDADRRFFSDEELLDGYRLACRAVIKTDCEVEIFGSGRYQAGDRNPAVSLRSNRTPGRRLKIAVDLGTTTIAGALFCSDEEFSEWDLHSSEKIILNKSTVINHQRSYGADVISRIKAADEGHGEELQRIVTKDIEEIFENLLGSVSENDVVEDVVIAGNTTMLHLLMGYSCAGLGKAPYKPVKLSFPVLNYSDVFMGVDRLLQARLHILPGISAFVGADIVAGMYDLGFDKVQEGQTVMLIDLGTNGEMAIAGPGRITVASTAAGPVFEGGGISCGMAGVAGAIEHVTLEKNVEELTACVKTVRDEKPVGICGSGVLEIVSELAISGAMDETGLLDDKYFEKGFPVDKENGIFFTQQDVRAVQLAKAAIRSGIDTLLHEHGINAGDVNRVYLAGGFSEHLDLDKIRILKMLPEEFHDREVCVCAGNTSLAGCIKASAGEAARQTTAEEALSKIISMSREVVLANEDSFGEIFIESMNF